MSDIKVQDNLLSDDDLKELQNKIIDFNFPWFLDNVIAPPLKPEVDPIDNYQHVHHFLNYHSSPFGPTSSLCRILNPIIFRMKYKSFVRIKVNLTRKTNEIVRHGFHIDDIDAGEFKDYKVSIFYLNSNDGYTEFEDGSRVESVANRLVTFPAYLPHTGTTCTDQPFRVVINFNYF